MWMRMDAVCGGDTCGGGDILELKALKVVMEAKVVVVVVRSLSR